MTTAPPQTLELLLVDDDEVDRMALRRAAQQLEGLTVKITEAADASEALQALKTGAFGCAILDLNLPGRDGGWLLQAAREAGVDIPLVMMTGQGDEQTAVNLMKAGASDYLPKALLTPERLGRTIRQALHLHWADHEAKRVAQALAESEERLRLALSVTGMGSWDGNFETGHISWDLRFRELLNIPAEAQASYELVMEHVHPEDRAHVESGYQACLSSTQDCGYEVEFRVGGPAAAQTGERWLRANGRLFVRNGTPVRMTGTILDITDQKRQQEQAERQREFDQQLLGIVSHDLRNPIAAMMMAASLLMRQEETGGRMLKPLGRIVSSGERASRMIRDLLDFTQARVGGGIPVHCAEADWHQIAQHTIEEVEMNHPQREVVLTCEGDGLGSWDVDRIAQILTNLVANALTYSAPGSPVRVKAFGDDRNVCLEVKNSGAPIPQELLLGLFQPFKRGKHNHDPNRSIGLGLYIVKELVDAHGGRVEVHSTAEDGTTFTVLLPRHGVVRRESE